MNIKLTLLIIFLSFSLHAQQGLVINEFVASSDENGGIQDPGGSYPDWVELYNNNNAQIDISGVTLTDDPDDLQKFTFPEGTLMASGAYIIIWADKDLDEEGYHADFKLSADGEYLQLTQSNGITVLDSITFGPQETNVAYARIPNGTGNFTMQTATFDANNESSNNQNIPNYTYHFNLSPNPSSGFIHIQITDSQSKIHTINNKLDLYNIKGQHLIDFTSAAQVTPYSIQLYYQINDLPSGTYLVKHSTSQGSTKTIKFVLH